MIQMTTDYNIFKKCPSNRPLDEANVIKVMRSIAAKDLLKYRPILLSPSMEIIDGQHRLEAAKRLGLPLYYEIQEQHSPEDIIRFNVQKAWKHTDYLNYYCKQGYRDYIRLQQFSDKYNTDFYTTCRVLNMKIGGQGKTNNMSQFKMGSWKYPSDEAEKAGIEKLEKFRTVIDFLKSRSVRDPKILAAAKFKDVLFDLLNMEELDFLGFIRNLELQIDKLHLCVSYSGYRHMLVEIYNFRRRERIEV